MARPRKSDEEKRAAKAAYARIHARSGYPDGLIQQLIEAPVPGGISTICTDADNRLSGNLGYGGRRRIARRVS